MHLKTPHRNSYVVLLFIVLVIMANIILKPIPNVISWDVFGYYLYLPGFFIYNDLGFNNGEWLTSAVELYNSTDTIYQISQGPLGNNINKYSMGMAFLYLPFFLVAHAFALLFNYPADGFSLPYQAGILMGSFCYFVVGLVYLRKVLLFLYSDKVVAIVMLLICFGTNYFHIQVFNGAMPHNYLFALYAILLWLTIKWNKNPNARNSVFLGLTIGLIALTRPTEIICILIPLLYGVFSWLTLKQKVVFLYKNYTLVFVVTLVAFFIGLSQLLYWKIFAGSFIYYSYNNNGEGLDFASPHIIDVLFSFRKGWLIYTPIMFFSIVGLFKLFKEKNKLFIPITLFFMLNLYFVSSWSNWWYASSFSQRALMQSYAVLAIPMAGLINTTQKLKNKSIKYFIYVVLGILVGLNLFQSWQESKGIIHGSRMTKEYYFSVFGQTNSPTKDQKDLLLVERPTVAEEKFIAEEKYKLAFTEKIDFENIKATNVLFAHAFSGARVCKLDSLSPFSASIKKKFKELTTKDHAWIKVSLWVYPKEGWQDSKLSLITTFDHKGKGYKYRGLNTEEKLNLIPNQWNKIEMDYLTPEVRTKNDMLIVYAWLRGKKEILIDDIGINVFVKK